MVIRNILFYKILGAIVAPVLAISLALYFMHTPSFHLGIGQDASQLQQVMAETKLQALSELLNHLKHTLIKDPTKKAGYDIKKFSWQRDVFSPITAAIKEILMGTYDEPLITKVLTSIEVIADEFQNANDPAYNAELATLADAWRNEIYDLFISSQASTITAAATQAGTLRAIPKKIQALHAINAKKLPHSNQPTAELLKPLNESVDYQNSTSSDANNTHSHDNNDYAYDADFNDPYFDTFGSADVPENYYEHSGSPTDYAPAHNNRLPRANTTTAEVSDTKKDAGPVVHKPTEEKNNNHPSSNGPIFLPSDSAPASDNHSPQEAAAFTRQMQAILNRAEKNALLDAKRKTEAVEIYI